ncbi:hypothetical protein ABT010_07510 [Streptomyces sp. NPDC002668]|uniref:aromatic-ring hydroxylase C-terminal domain-containing protein n=1 Tax=Streptomyces sp. NPDC002668 TaxID=3154422 RepID=UPI0033337229
MTGSRETSRTQELHAGRGVLLDLEDNAVLRGRASGWSDREDIVTAAPTGSGPAARAPAHRPSSYAPTGTWPGPRPAATTPAHGARTLLRPSRIRPSR